ncbi:uncharacterized protein FIBRA_08551 [Fibroporia radiculosa]|uniref:U3 small nucleolar RNA-associated protein 22 n=1 Tax=Fibroporia radiculosa TaxID=599839 RepID=J4GX07_9APHY|nr:uncharacterized protein FIBRA_08551 [Fibroporia radiculosa]CCM06300.1 predicted protein [Fibroporia radiculosa]
MSNLKRKRGTETHKTSPKRRRPGLENVSDAASIPRKQSLEDGVANEEDEYAESEGSVQDGIMEEWSGISEQGKNMEAAGHSGTHTHKPPRGEELRDIKDAADLYRSTSFKLQIDVLLPNIRPKYARSAPLERFLFTLYTFLKDLSPVAPQHPLSASRDLLKKGIAVPYPLPLPTEDTNWKVSFEKPSDILLVGSWAVKMSVKAKDQRRYVADVAVTMPETLFQEKDYMNSRFFHKRAYYLAVIAGAVSNKKSGMDVDVFYESASGDPRLTTLVLRPKHGMLAHTRIRSASHDADQSAVDFTSLNVEVRIMPVLPSSSPIPLQRLSPSRSNIRISSNDAPSPLCNSALLLCTTYKSHMITMHALAESVPAFADALALLRVWANQRGYGVGDRLCMRHFDTRGPWWAAVLELLVNGEESLPGTTFHKTAKRKPLGKGLSSYQLFKAALDLLARHDFEKEHIFVKTNDGHRFPPEDYALHEAVFVDSTSTVNLLAGVPLSALEMLRHDAKMTLDILDHSNLSEDPFDAVFMRDKRDVATRFDIVLRLNLSSAKLRDPNTHASVEHGSAYNALLEHLVSCLYRGLGNRTKAISVLHPAPQARPVSQAHPSNPSTIHVGLLLDTEHAFRLVDHGPTAEEQDSEAAQAFREFWGEKAELRRFKDGSIVESVVWSVSTADERTHIPVHIARHVLARHCGLIGDAVRTWQTQFDSVVRLPESITGIYRTTGAQTGFKAAMSAFDELVRAMKGLDDRIPLAILTVSPIAEALRYTSVHSPVAAPGPVIFALPQFARYVEPMEIVIEFEKSARWPDDLRAIQKIKLAFFEALASALATSIKGLTASVVVGHGAESSDIADQACLEIVTADGWAFRARIWHDREAILLSRLIDDKPHIAPHMKRQREGDPQERQAALSAQEVYQRRFVHAPRHHRAIAALCHSFSAFAGTVRLVKRWFAAHWLLRGHVSVEAVELLCASVFLRSAQSTVEGLGSPGSKERGFALVVELLKDWEWSQGMYIPLYHGTDDGGDKTPAVTVTAGAKTGVWALATELDSGGHVWTSSGPDAIVARRIRALAQATWVALQGMESGSFEAMTLFLHPLEHYDFIIELDPAVLPRYVQNVRADPAIWAQRAKYANTRADAEDVRLCPGFDPAQAFFDDLKRVYKDTFILFYDPLGGDRFGAVWDPSLKAPRPFRALGGFSSEPIRKEGKAKDKDKALVKLNENAILSEIERMGAGLVKNIVIRE